MYAARELSKRINWTNRRPLFQTETPCKNIFQEPKTFVQQLRPHVKYPPQHKGIDINCYVGSDWAGDPDSRKSTSGASLFVSGANITAHSRTQQSVGLSFMLLVVV
jgi:hypothetical protein